MRKSVLLAICIALTGCATVTRGSYEDWSVQTDPAGAAVKLSSGETCTSPCTLHKRRKYPFQVSMDLPGYQQAVAQVGSRVKGGGGVALAGNAIIGGVIGVVVDVSTGSDRDLYPNPLVVKMIPGTTEHPVQFDTVSHPVAPRRKRAVEPTYSDNGKMSHLTNYGAEAKADFAKMQCDKDFELVNGMTTPEIYQASCADGSARRLQCDSTGCRAMH